jgi:hypothetical protein
MEIVEKSSPLTKNNNNNNTKVRLNFVIATGAAPVVPPKWRDAAIKANIPLYTYRSLLSPEGNELTWDDVLSSSSSSRNVDVENKKFLTLSNVTTTNRQLLIVGGGATACELGQSLAKFAGQQQHGRRRRMLI